MCSDSRVYCEYTTTKAIWSINISPPNRVSSYYIFLFIIIFSAYLLLYRAGGAIQLAIKSLNLTIGLDLYLADVLLSHLPTDRILRIIKKRIQQWSSKKIFNKILIPINVKSTHWYLGVLQRQQAGEYQLHTHNNCTSLINEQAENNLRAVGKVLSRLARQSGGKTWLECKTELYLLFFF